jgi:hypothetical protein
MHVLLELVDSPDAIDAQRVVFGGLARLLAADPPGGARATARRASGLVFDERAVARV